MAGMVIQVRVVNDDGHTVCVFRKASYFDKQLRPERSEAWGVTAKPLSEKWLARRDLPVQEARSAKPPVRTVDGQRYLNLPGLTPKRPPCTSVASFTHARRAGSPGAVVVVAPHSPITAAVPVAHRTSCAPSGFISVHGSAARDRGRGGRGLRAFRPPSGSPPEGT